MQQTAAGELEIQSSSENLQTPVVPASAARCQADPPTSIKTTNYYLFYFINNYDYFYSVAW